MAEKQGFWLWAAKPFRRGEKAEPTPVGASPRGALLVKLEELGVDLSAFSCDVNTLPTLSLPAITANPTKHTLLAQALLGGTSTAIYTAGAAYRDVLVYLINVDSLPRTAQVSLGTLDDTHSLVKVFPLAVGDRRPIEVPALANGNVLNGLCDSANKVTAEVWGIAV